MIRIRRVTSARLIEECQKLDRKLFPNDDPYTHQSAIWWLAQDDEGPVAFAALTPLVNEPESAFLSRAGVCGRARGQGLQKKLIRLRERYARRAGFINLISYTAKDNMPSANNLASSGFKLYLPAWNWGCNGALYFYKKL